MELRTADGDEVEERVQGVFLVASSSLLELGWNGDTVAELFYLLLIVSTNL
jgi:hypothetical protein